jgi:hypothetical protein
MTDFADFKAQIAEWQNREDWSDTLVTSFIRMAEQKFNQELRISRMIQSDDGTVVSRCAGLPDDWLEMSLVSLNVPPPSNGNGGSDWWPPAAPSGWLPIRYKARDEFFQLPDKWAQNYYTIEGRQIYFGGTPDTVNGTTYRISYYGEVPVFSDTQDSWIYTKYPSLYLSAAMMHAFMHAVGEEQQAQVSKQLTEDGIQKLNDEWRLAKASGSRLTRSRHRSFG